MTKIIQVLKPQFRTEEVLSEIRECLEKGWSGIGYKTDIFEDEWKNYSGFNYAHFLNSATSGLHLCMRLFKEKYDWKDGDEVVTTSLTFVSTNHAILYEKLSPVFADVDDTLCLSPESVEKALTARTRAVMYVGIGGNAANYREIKKLCDEKNLIFIVDAAHMAGTRWVDSREHVGLDADCTIFSYQAVKNCPSADAGMVCFQDGNLDARARKMSWLGIDKSTYSRFSESSYKWHYDVTDIGFKYHGNSIMAAMCLVALKYLEADNEHRRMIANVYDDLLKNNQGVKIISHSAEIISSRHTYQVISESRDELIDKLARKGIFCGVHYIENSSYTVYKDYKNFSIKAKYLSDRLISLPLHLGVTIEDANNIVKAFK
jgi:dTDP-4-amino-4,6-dideoxygalactose transaminase